MTNRILAAAALMVLAASAGAAAGVDGKWTAEVPGRQGTMEMVFDLKADGDKVTGTIYNDFMGESEIQDGKIEGDEVSFKQVMEMGRTLTFTYTGKIKGDEIEFTRAMEGGFGGRGGGRGGPGARGGRRGGEGGEGRARDGEGRPGGRGEARWARRRLRASHDLHSQARAIGRRGLDVARNVDAAGREARASVPSTGWF